MEGFQHSHRRGQAAGGAAAAAATTTTTMSRKISNGGGTASATSSKSVCYDDVFGGPPRYTLPFIPTRPEDYGEIFGCASSCSIPVLDLPPADGGGGGYDFPRVATLDYLDIFGGFGGGDFAVSYEELFKQKNNNPSPSSSSNSNSSCCSRSSKRTGCEEQATTITGFFSEGPNEDHGAFLELGKDQLQSKGVTRHLNDDAKQFNMSYHMASQSSKEDVINGTVHMSQLHAVPGYTFTIDGCSPLQNTKNDNPPIEVSETVLSTPSCGSMKSSRNDLKADQKQSKLKFTASKDVPANEKDHSCSSSSQSASNGVSAQSSSDHSLRADFVGGITEGKHQRKTVPSTLTCSTRSSGNDLKVDWKQSTVRCAASEDLPANELCHSCSSSDHSTSSGAEAKHLRKPMSPSPSCVSLKSSEIDLKADQKQFITESVALQSAPATELQHSRSSSNQSISSWDQSYPDGTFLTVSDINLRTQPSRVPPPARPPPARPPSKSDLGERNSCKPSANHQIRDARDASNNHALKQDVKGSSPPFFDVEVDASSAAAASVAAMKEAMEQAQARLTSAKISMERKKDNLQSRKKLGSNEEERCKRKEDETTQQDQRPKEEVVQVAHVDVDNIVNGFSAEKMATAFMTAKLAPDLKEKGRHIGSAEESLQIMQGEEFRSAHLSYIPEERAGEWKVEEKFFELVKNDKKFKKVQEKADQEGNEKKLKVSPKVNEEEPSDSKAVKLASEPKKKGKLLAASKTGEWEDNSNNLLGANLASEEEEIKETPKATAELYVQEENETKLKEALYACHREGNVKKLREVQDTEQENNRRASEEAFLFEVSEKNLNTNIYESHKYEVVYESEDEEKKLKVFGGAHKCEESEKKMNVTKNCEGIEGGKNVKIGSKALELDENKKEVELSQKSCVSKEGMNLKASCKTHQDNLKKTNRADKEPCYHEENEMKPKEPRVSFDQGKSKKSNETQRACELVENENKFKAAQEAHDCKENEKKMNAVQEARGYTGNEKKVELKKEAKKLSRETQGELQLNDRKQNAADMTCELGDVEDNLMAPHGDSEKRKNKNIMDAQIAIDSKERVNYAQEVFHRIENEKELEDAQQALLLGEQGGILKTARESTESQDTEQMVKNVPEAHKTEEKVKEERMESQQVRKLEEKERERTKFEEEKVRERRKLEEEKERERRKLEEEKERERRKLEEKERDSRKLEEEKAREKRKLEERERETRKLEEEKEREREREKDRQAVERATLEARERAFAEVRERAERAAVERVTAEARQRALAEAREKAEKAAAEALEKSLAEKASREARLRAERAAVERATAEAHERAVEALAEKAAQDARERAERFAATSRDRQRKDNEVEGNVWVNSKDDSRMKQNTSFSHDMRDSDHQFQNVGFTSSSYQRYSDSSNHEASFSNEMFGGTEGESAIRCKARLERHQRTVERAAKALAEKNLRDIVAQREQAERHRLAEILDADVRRWSNGKEGNLRALLSTLQYILGPESGWQPISLTDVITAPAVKKAYRKATLSVHPDKLQQRGASIQQKYICEKVFDLLKEAWNRFNSEER